MNKHFNLAILTLIIIIGAFFRFYRLDTVPNGLYVDEAAQGYNAYSLLKTGKDEFGKNYPIVFRSFNDFKTPIYTYLLIPFVKLFDLNVFAVRLPSALAGLATIALIYLLVRKLTGNYAVAITSSLLLAISPWHILISRGAFEVNLSLFFYLLALYLFYISLKKAILLPLSVLLFTLTLLSYHAQKVIVPFTILFLFIRHRKILTQKVRSKWFVFGVVSVFILLLPTIAILKTPAFWARANGLNLFSREDLLFSIRQFFALYLSYFSPRYMFDLGDHDQKMLLPGLSTFFVWQFPFYLYGLIRLIRTKKSEFRSVLLFLLLVSPIPASMTRDPYTTIRSLPIVVPQLIIIALGINSSAKSFLNSKTLKIFSQLKLQTLNVLFFCLIVISFLQLYSSLFVLFPYHRAHEWNFGYRELTGKIGKLDPDIPIVLDDSRLKEPYIEYLFFSKYPPHKYQNENSEVTVDNYYNKLERDKNKKIGNLEIRPISWKSDLTAVKYLIGDHLAISEDQMTTHDLTLVEKIYFPNGETVFQIVRTSPQE